MQFLPHHPLSAVFGAKHGKTSNVHRLPADSSLSPVPQPLSHRADVPAAAWAAPVSSDPSAGHSQPRDIPTVTKSMGHRHPREKRQCWLLRVLQWLLTKRDRENWKQNFLRCAQQLLGKTISIVLLSYGIKARLDRARSVLLCGRCPCHGTGVEQGDS